MKQTARAALFLMTAPLAYPTQATPNNAPGQLTIAFDLGGVLFEPTEQSYARELGVQDAAAYRLLTGKGCWHLWVKLYETLARMQNGQASVVIGACDPHGNRTPALVCDWLQGKKSCNEKGI